MRPVFNTLRSAAMATALVAGLTALPAASAQSTFDITVLAGACANCHGTDGRSPGGIPAIAGRPESVLVEKLRAFKSDTPPADTTIMNRLIKGFGDDDLLALARHFSQISASTPPAKKGL